MKPRRKMSAEERALRLLVERCERAGWQAGSCGELWHAKDVLARRALRAPSKSKKAARPRRKK